jgi:hypothetical protein
LPKNKDRRDLGISKLSEKKKVYQFYVVEKGLTISYLLSLNCKYTALLLTLPKVKTGEIPLETVIEQSKNGNP